MLGFSWASGEKIRADGCILVRLATGAEIALSACDDIRFSLYVIGEKDDKLTLVSTSAE